MHPSFYLGVIGVLLAATVTARVLGRTFGAPRSTGRYATIDGLRGYLALFVFLHHSSIWFFFLHGDGWKVPPSRIFTIFGKGGVAMFFMITGFLFFGKLLDRRNGSMDWTRLYASRVLRLVPMYAFAMAALFVVVGVLSGWTLKVPLIELAKSMGAWLGFTLLGNPDINGVSDTSNIIASVTWSLPLEWMFYISLPIVAMAVAIRPSRSYLVFATIAIGAILLTGTLRPGIVQASWFLGGMVSALAVRAGWFRSFAGGSYAIIVVILALAGLFGFFQSADGIAQALLMTVVFALVAGGCTVFGVLATPASRILGDIAYGVYLLHGILLFVVLRSLGAKAAALSAPEYWALVTTLAVVLVAMCFATFRIIEKPAMESLPRVMERLSRGRPAARDPDEAVEHVASS